MPVATVRVFRDSEWQIYRDLRLRALKDSPSAFGTTYDESLMHPDEYWISRLAGLSPDADLPMLAECDRRPAGLAWGKIEPTEPSTAHLFGMWVAPQYRGHGVGRMLLMRAVQWARSQRVESVVLGVTCGNTAARALYESIGFTPIGTPEPIRPNREVLVQNMQLKLGHRTASPTTAAGPGGR
jgi:ribosomal protein S18 acetylase RimI-like enzyme